MLKDRAAIVGVAQTAFSKALEPSEQELACDVIVAACVDAGLDPSEIDGMASYTIEDGDDVAIARSIGAGDLTFFAKCDYGGGAGAATVGLLAMAVAAATGKRALAIGIPTGIAAATYMAYLAAQLVDSLHWLRWLSPFHAATTGGPLGPTLPALVWTMPLVGIVALAVTAPVFHSRDLTA